jgi:hypothetical protein
MISDPVTYKTLKLYGLDYLYNLEMFLKTNDPVAHGSRTVDLWYRSCDLQGVKNRYRLGNLQSVKMFN